VVPADATIAPATPTNPVEAGAAGTSPQATPSTLFIPFDPEFAFPNTSSGSGSANLSPNPIYGSIAGSLGATGAGAGPPTVLSAAEVTQSYTGRPVARFQLAGSGGRSGLAVAAVSTGAIAVVGLKSDGGSVMMVGETGGGAPVVVGVQTSPELVASIRSRFTGADVEVIFDPAPSRLSDVQRGSLGGGNTTPTGAHLTCNCVWWSLGAQFRSDRAT